MYGLQILDQNGMKDIGDMLSVRVIDVFTSQQTSGSYTAPTSWQPTTDTYFLVSSQGYQLPKVSISGRTFSWQSYQGNQVSFTFYLLVVNSSLTEGGYGFLARNAAGGVVMDQRYSVLSVKSRGTSSGPIAAENVPDGSYHHSIACSAGDIVAAKVGVGMYVATGPYNNGARAIFHSEPTIDYLVLSSAPGDPGPENYGLVLYDANGNRTYDSRIPILSIRTAQSGQPGYQIGGLAAADQYVACSSPFWLWIDDLNPTLGIYFGSQMYYGFERINSSTLTTKAINGIGAQSMEEVFGPIPNDAEMVALVGRG